MEDKIRVSEDTLTEFTSELEAGKQSGIDDIEVSPENVEAGLAKLVLTIIELLRRLLEKEAIKRMEAGSLDDEEIERMGMTFLKLKERLIELKEEFGIEDEELNLNLGPLGDLM